MGDPAGWNTVWQEAQLAAVTGFAVLTVAALAQPVLGPARRTGSAAGAGRTVLPPPGAWRPAACWSALAVLVVLLADEASASGGFAASLLGSAHGAARLAAAEGAALLAVGVRLVRSRPGAARLLLLALAAAVLPLLAETGVHDATGLTAVAVGDGALVLWAGALLALLRLAPQGRDAAVLHRYARLAAAAWGTAWLGSAVLAADQLRAGHSWTPALACLLAGAPGWLVGRRRGHLLAALNERTAGAGTPLRPGELPRHPLTALDEHQTGAGTRPLPGELPRHPLASPDGRQAGAEIRPLPGELARQRRRRPLTILDGRQAGAGVRLLGLELLALLPLSALAIVLPRLVPVALPVAVPGTLTVLPPLDAVALVVRWRLDPLVAGVLLGLAAWGRRRRLAGARGRWWWAGLAVAAVAALGGPAVYAPVVLPVRLVQQVLLGLVVTACLVRGSAWRPAGRVGRPVVAVVLLLAGLDGPLLLPGYRELVGGAGGRLVLASATVLLGLPFAALLADRVRPAATRWSAALAAVPAQAFVFALLTRR